MNKFDKTIDHLKQKTIWMIWTGDNEMSSKRKFCLEQFCEINKNCNVCLITKEDIEKLPDLHKGFKYLSETHKADYLRAYLMHNFGGGYADIKVPSNNWFDIFEEFASDENYFIVGYPESGPGDIARVDLCRIDANKIKYLREYCIDDNGNWTFKHVEQNWQKMIGNGSYICKKNTVFTKDWIDAINEKMDLYYNELQKNPASFPQDQCGIINPTTEQESKYPLVWSDICGSIFHPLNLKYSDKIKQNNSLKHELHEYR